MKDENVNAQVDKSMQFAKAYGAGKTFLRTNFEQQAAIAEKVTHDRVNHPAHYTQTPMEPIDAIEGLQLGFYAGNVLKYLARYKFKNGLEDLLKAQFYLNKLIALERKETGEPALKPVNAWSISSRQEGKQLHQAFVDVVNDAPQVAKPLIVLDEVNDATSNAIAAGRGSKSFMTMQELENMVARRKPLIHESTEAMKVANAAKALGFSIEGTKTQRYSSNEQRTRTKGKRKSISRRKDKGVNRTIRKRKSTKR